MDVYNDPGPGFLENVYQEAMVIEVNARKIPSKPSQEIHIKYKGSELKKFYIADLICYDKIVVELKAMDKLTLREEGQLINSVNHEFDSNLSITRHCEGSLRSNLIFSSNFPSEE